MLNILHIFLNFILIFSSLLIFFVENTIHSLLLLILTFLEASIICFIFNADFLGLILIIIYVGAIAVLFLFIIMMLNVKTQSLNIIMFIPSIILLFIIFVIQFYTFLSNYFLNFSYCKFSVFLFEFLSNNYFLSQTLYNYFLICFLIAGLILLVGMIGAIILTLNFNNKKQFEISFRKLSRTDNIIDLFNNKNK